ncbi:beta-glucoside-specific PTS transporter subunit IIABC [Lactobacillus mulieris]|uniref:PTS system sucrose-specific EIIBCA component n=1 Tax=Lactobacillus mulieris TaxID=2508708 RepID=A0AAP3M2R7_9LACO|nr:beta-glucoside-specific PTS transporter subunit IIABC [Lactobacillus mulieris]MCF1784108.1 beta-glucoside-specific PTS transporter subunit IIABC [Lactobacillus mulieris]MCZ3844265.1 beta-glucoside-specific PTS transporter subunit IIABC [Lactobacillus mulieris]MCZ3875926.1 beta-glucoside-specific PTS transporter subunit IIABC [Lactobacillus mulieris]MCZ3899362.1 beta-glucoside-specific PTS transporter subunit IIABC [Lactobacillus mulieris]MCZ9649007.1 beta-glucoside-specific PTS transporter 
MVNKTQYKTWAKEIIQLIGGKENVNSLVHCVTRLRFKLKDEKKANDEAIKNLNGVITVVHSGGQYQVVIGDAVTDVYDEIMPRLGLKATNNDEDTSEKGNILNRLVSLISSLFMPTLGVMSGAGILKGLLVLLTITKLVSQNSGTYMILNAAGDALFYFLPVFIGFSAAKTFKMNSYLGGVVGAALVYPTLIAAYTAKKSIDFLGIHVGLMNYSQTLLPVLVAVYAMYWLQKGLKRILPKSLANIFVPAISLMVIVPLTFLLVGPITQGASVALSDVIIAIYQKVPVVAGFILAGIWQGAIIFGLHWAFIPIFINNMITKGSDPINAMLYCTLFGQVGAALAMALKAKDTKFKEIAFPAVVSGFLGITEPIIYGVTLPHKKAFGMASIGSAFGGAIAAFGSAHMYTMPGGGIFGLPCFINPKAGIDFSFICFVLSLIVSFTIALVLTFIFGDRVVPATKNKVRTTKFMDTTIASPFTGKVMPLKELNDGVFSTGAVGKGIAVIPENGEVKAPFDGTVVSVFPTKHAIALKSKSGVELLIHIGLDTVELKGKGFKQLVHDGDSVRKGDLLETVDLDLVKKAGYNLASPVIVTNPANFDKVLSQTLGHVQAGDQLLLATVDQAKSTDASSVSLA